MVGGLRFDGVVVPDTGAAPVPMQRRRAMRARRVSRRAGRAERVARYVRQLYFFRDAPRPRARAPLPRRGQSSTPTVPRRCRPYAAAELQGLAAWFR